MNYPLHKCEVASCFNATCLLLQRVRSLTVTPHVYSQVPYEVLLSYTDDTNILKKIDKKFVSSKKNLKFALEMFETTINSGKKVYIAKFHIFQ